MDLYQFLTILTCITSAATLMLVSVAVVPHFKHGLTVIRDAVLWATLVLVIALICWVAWDRMSAGSLGAPFAGGVGGKAEHGARSTPVPQQTGESNADPFFVQSRLP